MPSLHHVRPTRSPRPRPRVRGIALIEALVGILIFTIGILGLVGLQAAMLRAQGSARIRADAALLANEVIGMMWTDAGSQANLQNYSTGCNTGSCSDWINKVAQTLPDGTATFNLNNASGVTTITITWTQPNEGTHKYITSTSATACLITVPIRCP